MTPGKIPENYCFIPRDIFKDNRMVAEDIVLISVLFSRSDPQKKVTNINRSELLELSGLSFNNYQQALKRLKKYGWVKKMDFGKEKRFLTFSLDIPATIGTVYKNPGSKIARAWNNYFGTRLIKYEDLQDLVDFVVNRGMEEELVLHIMKYSGRKAKGDPLAYSRAILINLAKKGILTVDDYERERKEGVSGNGKEVSKTTGGKEKRTQDEIARGYYKKGYR
ncbi:MAG TPA: DnaD domain protein [Halanaerobiales bacterium]|nr:DnaD domain protein [Halanaerobiales bacterium]